MFTLCFYLLALAAAIYIIKHLGEILALFACFVLFTVPVLLVAALGVAAWVCL